MALGLGLDAGDRLRLRRSQRARGRLAPDCRDRRARARRRALSPVAPPRSVCDDLRHPGALLGRDEVLARRPLSLSRARRARRAALSRERRRWHALQSAVLHGASARLGAARRSSPRADDDSVLSLPPEEQYLVATGRTYFRDLAFDELHRLQFDLETTGLDARARPHLHDRGARSTTATPRCSKRRRQTTRRSGAHPPARRRRSQAADPDVIENHNLHGFDLPFLERARAHARRAARARPHRRRGLRQRARAARRCRRARRRRRAARALRRAGPRADRHARRGAPPRFLDARSAGSRAKAVARTSGSRRRIASTSPAIRSTRPTAPIRSACAATPPTTSKRSPRLSRMLGGAAFALAQMAPRRYERLADAGAATGVIDPLLVRAYLRAGHGAPRARAGRRHAAQRRGAASLRHRRRAPRREGRRREPVSVADARVPHRPGARSARRAARARRSRSSSGGSPRRRRRAPRRRARRSVTRTKRCRRR